MKSLLIFGSGGHGQSVLDAALCSEEWDGIAFCDDISQADVCDYKVLASQDDGLKMTDRYAYAAIALGDNALREIWHRKAKSAGFILPVIRHPFSSVGRFSEIGEGSVIMPGVSVVAGSRVGSGCILNTGSTVDHNCAVSDFAHLSPGVHLGGSVAIGKRCWLCVGVSVGGDVGICDDCVIGAGAAVVSNITKSGMWAGVPAVFKHGL